MLTHSVQLRHRSNAFILIMIPIKSLSQTPHLNNSDHPIFMSRSIPEPATAQQQYQQAMSHEASFQETVSAEFDKQSVSTKMPLPAKAASFSVPAQRTMYANKTDPASKKMSREYSNILALTPDFISRVVHDSVQFLDDGETFVVQHDSHYTIVNQRSRSRMLPRHAPPGSQHLASNSRQPGSNVFLESLSSYSEKDAPSMYHCNITKYSPSEGSVLESRDIHFYKNPKLTFLSFLTLENSKKALILSSVSKSENTFCLSLVDIHEANKTKNPKHLSMKKKASYGFSLKSEEQERALERIPQSEYLVCEPVRIDQQFALRENQKLIKMINSEFGDAVLLITSFDIYSIEFDAKKIAFSGYGLLKQLEKKIEDGNTSEAIKDAQYAIGGLKVIFATESGYFGLIEAETITNLQHVRQMTPRHEDQSIQRIHSLVGKVAIETSNATVLLVKINEKGECYPEKKVELPTNTPGILSYQFGVVPKNDELLFQTVSKRQSTYFSVQKKSILSQGNDFMEVYSSLYKKDTNMAASNFAVASSSANGIVCVLSENEVTFFRIYEGFSSDKKPVEQLFVHSFFERPLGVSIDPYGSVVVIRFREFVKFFNFEYGKLEQFYTFNTRNVNYAGFTSSGEHLLMALDDMLFFLNPFSFETTRAMEAYGDIKSVSFYDTSLYMLLRNKVNKHDQDLILQCYCEKEGEYEKVEEFRIRADEAVFHNRELMIVASRKQIRVYRNGLDEASCSKRVMAQKQIKLADSNDFPTCLNLCEALGVLMIGTAQGKIYQYLWPFLEEHEADQFSVTECSTSAISSIRMGTTFEKMQVFCQNKSIVQMEMTQYVEGQEMANIYTINPKSLYDPAQLKYQFSNREYLYQNYTTYVLRDMLANNEVVEELEFVQEKLKDDLEEYIAKTTSKIDSEVMEIRQQQREGVAQVQQETTTAENKILQSNAGLKEIIAANEEAHREAVEKGKDQYEKKLLELYKEATRLRNIYADLEREQIKEKDIYRLHNEKVMKALEEEAAVKEQEFQWKFREIFQKADRHGGFVVLENQEWKKELEEYRQFRHTVQNEEMQEKERAKEKLIGSIGYFQKEIINFNKRKDEFQSLIGETKLQIEELRRDRSHYQSKKAFLQKELKDKEKLIEAKEQEVITFVKETTQMKKVKNTHEFELKEYESEFEPILAKTAAIEQDVKKMNEEILSIYNDKVRKESQIEECQKKQAQLQAARALAIQRKQVSQTKIDRFLSKLTSILEDPLNPQVRNRLNEIALGEKYQINEEALLNKASNEKLLRKKELIRKAIEENEKREQHIVRNKNEFFKHYNENTVLVGEYNELKQYGETLESKMKKLEDRLRELKSSNIKLETPRIRKKTASLLELKKFSEKKLTPFQRHEQEYREMFNKGSTTETKITRSGESMSFLKTLMKDVERTDSRYEKMELVRDRVRSFINPEIKARKPIAHQRMLFDTKQKGTLNSLGY